MPKGISEKLREQRRKIAEDVERIGERNEVAQLWKCSRVYVDKSCKEFGIEVGHLKQADIVAILWRLIQTEETLVMIAEKLGVSYQQVDRLYRICLKAGFKIARPRGRPRKDRMQRVMEGKG